MIKQRFAVKAQDHFHVGNLKKKINSSSSFAIAYIQELDQNSPYKFLFWLIKIYREIKNNILFAGIRGIHR